MIDDERSKFLTTVGATLFLLLQDGKTKKYSSKIVFHLVNHSVYDERFTNRFKFIWTRPLWACFFWYNRLEVNLMNGNSFFSKYKFYFICSFLIVLIGFIGFLIPIGDEKWNFIFENMIWFPFELSITVFVLQKILDYNNQKQEKQKEIQRFSKLAENETSQFVKDIKTKALSAFTGEMVFENVDHKFRVLVENFDSIITIDYLKQGIDTFIFNPANPMDSFNNRINVKHIQTVNNFAKELENVVLEYISKYNAIIPNELMDEISILRNVFQESKILGTGEYADILSQVFNNNNFSDKDIESYQGLQSELRRVLNGLSDSIERIEEILDNYK